MPIVLSKGEKSTLGNIEIGIKHNFYNKNWLISGQITVEANTSSFDNTQELERVMMPGQLHLFLAMVEAINKWYLQGFTGVNIRTNNYSSSFKIGGEVGKKNNKKHLVSWLCRCS